MEAEAHFPSTSAGGWGGGSSSSWGRWVCAQVVEFQQRRGGGLLQLRIPELWLWRSDRQPWVGVQPPSSFLEDVPARAVEQRVYQQPQQQSSCGFRIRPFSPYSVRLRTVVAPCCYSSLNELSLLFSPPALHILLTAPLFKIPVVVSSDWTVTSTYTYKLNTKIEGKLGAWVAQRVKRLPLAQS